MPTEVRNAPDRSRYELLIDGELVGLADYQERDGALAMPHTEISEDHRGQGLGDVLVAGALEDVRAQGRKIIPACSFVRDYVARHPEVADLVA